MGCRTDATPFDCWSGRPRPLCGRGGNGGCIYELVGFLDDAAAGPAQVGGYSTLQRVVQTILNVLGAIAGAIEGA
jgi:hypothetical protein